LTFGNGITLASPQGSRRPRHTVPRASDTRNLSNRAAARLTSRNRTPTPPPLSSMNSTPAASCDGPRPGLPARADLRLLPAGGWSRPPPRLPLRDPAGCGARTRLGRSFRYAAKDGVACDRIGRAEKNKNAIKHGVFTKEAIEEWKQFQALIGQSAKCCSISNDRRPRVSVRTVLRGTDVSRWILNAAREGHLWLIR
jgi:hypothetical protein